MSRAKSYVSLMPLILSCEHYGTRIPSEMKHVLAPNAWVLRTHRGSDIGIASVYDALKNRITQHCFSHDISRLIVDANRSPDNPDVFSKYTNFLSDREKQRLLTRYHRPHRQKVSECVEVLLKKNKHVLHISLHSFTPCLRGKRRNAQIGLLYDPSRPLEAQFCSVLRAELLKLGSRLSIRMNYPYRGTDDGLTVSLRKHFGSAYLGIELELNQSVIRGRPHIAKLLKHAFENCQIEF